MSIWKPVVGYEGLYEVSNQGCVRGVERKDTLGRRVNGKTLKPGTNGQTGHRFVCLHDHEGRIRQIYVHRIVLEAFVGACPPGMECLHGDDNPAHNMLSNLRWGTRSENLLDRYRIAMAAA